MATGTPKGRATKPSARSRPALPTVPFPSDVGPDLEGQLDRAASALWLLDQMHNGELCFLTMRHPQLPCWVSAPAAEAMRPEDVKNCLQDLALKTLASALGELRRLTQRTGRADR